MIWADAAEGLLVLALTVPVGLAAAMVVRAFRPLVTALAPWAAVPALVLAGGSSSAEVKWVLLGVRVDAVDPLGRGFLAFTALLWLFAAWFARTYIAESPHRDSFWFFFLTTMGGNIGVILAQDVASFYAFYALMTFAVYGLVVHERSDEARRAGRVYLAMALGGETLLVAAFLLITRESINLPLRAVPLAISSSPDRDLISWLLLIGFGVKAGAVPLHLWLPLAHPVAPAPASALLSGAIIKMGLLGWLRFLPLGVVALPTHGLVCVVLGAFSALYASGVGVTHTEPKTVLAYSSISQMGFVTATLGVGVMEPRAAEMAKAAILLFALHHAVAKGSLFLGAAVAKATGPGWPRRLVTLGLLFPAVAIAGMPVSSGALAKIALKDVVKHAPLGSSALGALLSVAAIGSTFLMLRFLSLTIPRRTAAAKTPSAGLWVPWALLLVSGVVLIVVPAFRSRPLHLLVKPDALWSAAWPALAGTGLAWIASHATQRGALSTPAIPAGDALVLIVAAGRRVQRMTASAGNRARFLTMRARAWPRHGLRLVAFALRTGATHASPERIEATLEGFGTIGALILLLLALLIPVLLRG